MKYVGIVIAMQEELDEVLNIMNNTEVREIYNLRFILGNIKNTNCVIVKSGVGKVNAARTTQIMINHFNIEYVVNIGVAGSVNSMLNIGDVIIADHVVQHDFDITAFDHSKGYITGVGDKIICDNTKKADILNILNKTEERTYNIKKGIVATGDIFCTSVAMKDKIHIKFDADVVDMECGAVGQVCYLDEVPFVAVRCISDTPDGRNETTFDENLKICSRRCANILKEIL